MLVAVTVEGRREVRARRRAVAVRIVDDIREIVSRLCVPRLWWWWVCESEGWFWVEQGKMTKDVRTLRLI